MFFRQPVEQNVKKGLNMKCFGVCVFDPSKNWNSSSRAGGKPSYDIVFFVNFIRNSSQTITYSNDASMPTFLIKSVDFALKS